MGVVRCEGLTYMYLAFYLTKISELMHYQYDLYTNH